MRYLNINFFLSLAATIVFTACGGSDENNNASQSSLDTFQVGLVETPQQGSFMDSAVEGLYYKTITQEGTTDSQGNFRYLTGESVEFYIGTYFIGKVAGSEIVTPYSLYLNDEDAALRVAQLLQSIDSDNDLSNGISLENAQRLNTLDNSVSPENVNFESELSEKTGVRLTVTREEAKSHLDETIATIENKIPDTTAPVFTLTNAVSVNENQTTALALAAIDTESTIIYSILGADSSSFNVNGTSGTVTFKTAPDYETKRSYAFTAKATDSAGNSVTQNVSVTILDVNESGIDRSVVHTVNLIQLAQAQGQTVHEYLIDQFEQKRPANFVENDTVIFTQYLTGLPSTYASGNWASQFDFSGVAWNGTNAGVLVTNQHILYAAHFPRAIGSTVYFNAKDGTVISRTIVAAKNLKNYDGRILDAGVQKLNAPVPEGIKIYSLLDGAGLGNTSDLIGVPYLITDKTRKVFAEEIYSFQSSGAANQLVNYWKKNDLPSFMFHSAVNGDSGNPQFMIVNGELVVTGTLYGYANGVMVNDFYGFEPLQDSLQQAIEAMIDF